LTGFGRTSILKMTVVLVLNIFQLFKAIESESEYEYEYHKTAMSIVMKITMEMKTYEKI